MAKINSGTYTAISTIDLNNDPMVIVDADDTTEDASGTTHTISLQQIFNALADTTLTDVAAPGQQALGSTGKAIDAGHVHPCPGQWIPSDNGLLAANAPLYVTDGGSAAIAGSLYLNKLWIRSPFTATNLWVNCSNLGGTVSTTSFCGIWSSAGTLLTGSSDISSGFASSGGTTGAHSLAFTTPQALTVAMNWVWVGFVFNMGTSQPTLRTLGASSATPWNTNLLTAQLASCINGTSVTSLANITPSANSVTNAIPYWIGIS